MSGRGSGKTCSSQSGDYDRQRGTEPPDPRDESWLHHGHVYEDVSEDDSAEPTAKRPTLRRVLEGHRVLVAALLGLLGGALFVVGYLVATRGWETTAQLLTPGRKVADPPATSARAWEHRVDTTIQVLEAIARNPEPGPRARRPFRAASPASDSDYERCCQECEQDFRSSDGSERALLADCKKECLVLYSERLKAIRERYYGQAEQN